MKRGTMHKLECNSSQLPRLAVVSSAVVFLLWLRKTILDDLRCPLLRTAAVRDQPRKRAFDARRFRHRCIASFRRSCCSYQNMAMGSDDPYSALRLFPIQTQPPSSLPRGTCHIAPWRVSEIFQIPPQYAAQ